MRKAIYKLIMVICIFTKSSVLYAEELTFFITEITEKEFKQAISEREPYKQPVLNEIKDLDEAIKQLSGRLILSKDAFEVKDANGKFLIKDHFNGKDIYQFVAYYPDEQLIYWNDEAGGDMLLSLDTGVYFDEDPQSRIYSPSGSYKFSGYYNAQEFNWFLQTKKHGKWVDIKVIAKNSVDPISILPIKQFTWLTDSKFLFRHYYEDEFYLGVLQKN